jgi:hypothetical protein
MSKALERPQPNKNKALLRSKSPKLLPANLQNVLEDIKKDPRYQKCIAWGKKRAGHDEGTIAAHIQELERNLEIVKPHLNNVADEMVLLLLIHTHDTFKSEAERKVSIQHPKSHASLGREYVESYLGKTHLSNMLQYHDDLYAIWRNAQANSGKVDQFRLNKLISHIEDWDLFLAFTIIDNTTKSKDLEPTQWAIKILQQRVNFSLNHQAMFDKIIEDFGNR